MKPGKPTTFATCHYHNKKKLILGLPGNPVSATVTSVLYLLPLCRKMSGRGVCENMCIKAKVGAAYGMLGSIASVKEVITSQVTYITFDHHGNHTLIAMQ